MEHGLKILRGIYEISHSGIVYDFRGMQIKNEKISRNFKMSLSEENKVYEQLKREGTLKPELDGNIQKLFSLTE